MTGPARIPDGPQGLFWCEHHAKLWTGARCLRLQVEPAKVRDPKTHELVPGKLPAYPHCAQACEQGRDIRAAIGSAPPPATPAEERAALAPRYGAPPQDRIWKLGEVPDVPIAPVPAAAGGLTATDEARIARRVRRVVGPRSAPPPFEEPGSEELDEMLQEDLEHPAPATPAPPATEEPMPAGVLSQPRTCCESRGSRHLKGCPEFGRATALGRRSRVRVTPKARPASEQTVAAEKSPAKPALAPPPPPRLALAGAGKRPAAVLGADGKIHEVTRSLPDLEALDEDALLALREACDAELARRLTAHESQAQRIRAALDHAKGAAA